MTDELTSATPVRIGAVSFLNTKPLIEGLADDRDISLRLAVPSRLGAMLRGGEVDAALVPVVDVARAGGAWQIISDACIASDGETLTVRVFSRTPPEDVRCVCTDGDSHTSVVLVRLIWAGRFGRAVRLRPLAEVRGPSECDAVLLIGDKVVSRRPVGFPHELDLGAAWKDLTGLPFVFAVWAAKAGRDWNRLARRLSAARDAGVAAASRLARQHGPPLGWPAELAEAYLTRHIRYMLTPEARCGLERFFDMARASGHLAEPRDLVTT